MEELHRARCGRGTELPCPLLVGHPPNTGDADAPSASLCQDFKPSFHDVGLIDETSGHRMKLNLQSLFPSPEARVGLKVSTL